MPPTMARWRCQRYANVRAQQKESQQDADLTQDARAPALALECANQRHHADDESDDAHHHDSVAGTNNASGGGSVDLDTGYVGRAADWRPAGRWNDHAVGSRQRSRRAGNLVQ
jgi:hypothetical protein